MAVSIIPLTRLLVGTSIGPVAATVPLVLVASAAAVWGVFVWRQRRRSGRPGAGRLGGYRGVPSSARRDDIALEEGDFDERRLDVATGREAEGRYSLGGDGESDDDESSLGKGPKPKDAASPT